MIRRYKNKKIKRKILVRSRVKKSGLPRLSVFRSNKYIYGQIIDDQKHTTLVAVSSREVIKTAKNNLEQAKKTGELLAQRAIKKNIRKVVFDRGAYKYHGRVKALAEGARSQGLKF